MNMYILPLIAVSYIHYNPQNIDPKYVGLVAMCCCYVGKDDEEFEADVQRKQELRTINDDFDAKFKLKVC